MSQMNGDLKFDLGDGVFWGAAIEIVPNGLPRQKVVCQIAASGKNDPELTLYLNESDGLILSARDRDGAVFETKEINKEIFATKRGFLFFEAYVSQPALGSKEVLTVRLGFGSEVERRESWTGIFSGQVDGGRHSFGAALDNSRPASFKLFELIVLGRAPLTQAEMKNLKAYINQKHGVGGGHE